MEKYKNKQELINEINNTYNLFIEEFKDVKNEEANKRIEGISKTPLEMISYQIGWLNHIMQWEKDELDGKKVVTPAPNIKWNELEKLYQIFYEKYETNNLQVSLDEFSKVKTKFINWIESLDEKVLFELDQRQWAYIKAGWPVWKWIHINSVAPFKSFRTLIRKWKKNNN